MSNFAQHVAYRPRISVYSSLAFLIVLAACGSSKPEVEPTPSPEPMAETGTTESPAESPAGDDIPRDAVYFAHDSAELDAEARAALDEQVIWMKENPTREVVLHGYASDVGEPTYNLTLANNRANAIREYLVSQGIDIGRVSVRSHGEEGPELDPAIERRAVFATDRQ